MRFVEHEDRAGFAAQAAQCCQKARCIAHHANVGHHWLGQDTGDITAVQRRLQRINIVKFDHQCCRQQILHLTDQAWPVNGTPVAQVDKDVIDRAMITSIEDQYLFAPRNSAAPADHCAVGLACRRRHLPLRQAEHTGEYIAQFRALGCGQHIAQPPPGLL